MPGTDKKFIQGGVDKVEIIFNIKNNFHFWPDEWIQSYKWEMRGKDKLGIVNGVRNFVHPGDPVILQDTKIAVFHGQPNMHNCVDEWPMKNWY